MILLSHPTGNANVRHAALALAEADMLAGFRTALAPNASCLGRFLQRLPGFGELKRRNVPTELIPLIRQWPVREIFRLIAARVGWRTLLAHETGYACVDAVYRDLDRRVARSLAEKTPPISAIYAYEDGALESFRAAKVAGVATIYDLPIGYWRTAQRIAREEAERLPAWAGTLPALQDSEAKLARKDEELQLAETIVVASHFTARTLDNAPFPVPEPVIVPYGCATPRLSSPAQEPLSSGAAHLRVLFVGSLSQRKGLHELFGAVDTLGPRAVTLTLVGSRVGECAERDRQLARHRWIPSLPHPEVLSLMRRHDVLVFPSLFEGFGLVITEALSQGLPVITTPHTGGPEVIKDGVDGFLVPIRDQQTIAAKLELLHSDRDRLMAMKHSALDTAREQSWQRYRDELVQIVGRAVTPELGGAPQ